MMARLGLNQIALLVARGDVPVWSQQVFHMLVSQKGNKIFDVCSLLKLLHYGAQNFFYFGCRTRELFS